MRTLPAEVLWTARYDYEPRSRLVNHKHKFFQVICIASGGGCFWLDGREIPILPRRIFLIRPGEVHGLSAQSHIKTLDLKFVVRDGAMKRALQRARNYIQEQRAAISSLVDQIRSRGERRGIFFREMCAAYLVQLLITYLEESGGGANEALEFAADEAVTSASDAVRKAVDFIREHYRDDLDGQALAHALGTSDRQLRHWFKDSVDISPMHYLACYRIERAKELIMSTNQALKAIAELCGFKTIHHFNHVFSEITGLPPGAWRRLHREGIGKDVCIDPHFSNVIRVRREEDTLSASRPDLPRRS